MLSSIEIYRQANLGHYLDLEDLIYDILAYYFIGWPTKTKLLEVTKAAFWHGCITGHFLTMSVNIDRTFNRMVAEGKLIYEPRKPVTIGDQS